MALSAMVLSPLATAQDAIDLAITRDELRAVADEYAEQTFGFDDTRLSTIRDGWIFPPRCGLLAYPTLEVGTAEEAHGASQAMADRIYSAVNAAYVKQNLLRMGIDDQRAQTWTDAYFDDLEAARPPQPTVQPAAPGTVVTAAAPPTSPAIRMRIETARITPGQGFASAPHRVADRAITPPISFSRLAATVSLRDRQALRTSAQIRTRPNAPESPAARLARTINADTPKPAGFPPIIERMSGGCMMRGPIAHQTPHLLKLQPATGSVFVIPIFLFKLCELKVREPYNRDKCEGWADVSDDPTPLLGSYQISAEWNNGGLYRARRDFAYHEGFPIWEIPLKPRPVP
ncbi:MAG: hypothetical protein J7500_14565 [Sphingomonas sp.]|uniref:hypothetical protein n=1 Tax=Sphingomonas sp. TaxID=28214 RepID=UPI001B0C5874|nr:hypothetical protein [Sphingomonas sp.]MBO9623929.1 hypothetical protein [Sphingomonas sp.]